MGYKNEFLVQVKGNISVLKLIDTEFVFDAINGEIEKRFPENKVGPVSLAVSDFAEMRF